MTIQEQLDAAGITIYKVRAIIMKKKKGSWTDVYRKDEIVTINSLERAMEVYREEKNNAECYTQYSKYSAIVELFIPHIFDNGQLAYWPDHANYIEQFRKR